eukprot:142003-Amphidinium_carterae.1
MQRRFHSSEAISNEARAPGVPYSIQVGPLWDPAKSHACLRKDSNPHCPMTAIWKTAKEKSK